MSEWDDGFAMYCGHEWKFDADHTHECRRSPGHHEADHWCFCGSRITPHYISGIHGEHDAPGT